MAEAEGAIVPATPVEEESGGGSAMCAEFLVKETGRKCQALLIPDGVRLNNQKLTALVTDTWKLTPPSIMLSCDAGTVHPKMFASQKLAELPSFDQFWADAKQHVTRTGVKEGTDEHTKNSLDVIVRAPPWEARKAPLSPPLPLHLHQRSPLTRSC
jgi:hypothetical protein